MDKNPQKQTLCKKFENVSFEMKEISVTVDIMTKEELSQTDTIENTLFLNYNSPDNDKDISERNNSKDLLSFWNK